MAESEHNEEKALQRLGEVTRAAAGNMRTLTPDERRAIREAVNQQWDKRQREKDQPSNTEADRREQEEKQRQERERKQSHDRDRGR